jgi:small-conductance mechanosensitive channel
MHFLFEETLGVFLLLQLALGGGAAWMTGRAIAQSWRPAWSLFFYLLLLTFAVRFLDFALFGGTLLSVYYFIVDFIILLVIGYLGMRVTRAGQMVKQYPWLYERAGPLSWRDRKPGVA